MTKQTVLLAALFVAGTLLASDAALAQGYDGRYSSPYGPTLTPYLDYFRRDNGVLNSYYNFVRPKIRANYDMRQIDAQLQRQDEQQSKLARDIRTQKSPAAATGTGATFMNYSHYYPQGRSPGMRR